MSEPRVFPHNDHLDTTWGLHNDHTWGFPHNDHLDTAWGDEPCKHVPFVHVRSSSPEYVELDYLPLGACWNVTQNQDETGRFVCDRCK